ncbi:hypothetical protein M3G00_13620 [Brevibacterium casei]|uniref:hypothetical protein n=1 Tax=Brevibacterium casei TaxID=33889 RepID=UPI0011A77648|nr:hypothetical protein [Brevibacterium casei]MCT2183971.1 hypothetical protein [Brevibacterium casei]
MDHDLDGASTIVCSRSIGAEGSVRLGELRLGRTARHGALQADLVLASALLMFGELMTSTVKVKFPTSSLSRQSLSAIWGIDIVSDPDTDILFAAAAPETSSDGVLVISHSLGDITFGDMGQRSLIVLPQDVFNGSIGSLFGLAVSSNAAYEATRIHGSENVGIGLVAVGLCMVQAFQASTIRFAESTKSMPDLNWKQRATLSSMGVKLEN